MVGEVAGGCSSWHLALEQQREGAAGVGAASGVETTTTGEGPQVSPVRSAAWQQQSGEAMPTRRAIRMRSNG